MKSKNIILLIFIMFFVFIGAWHLFYLCIGDLISDDPYRRAFSGVLSGCATIISVAFAFNLGEKE